MGCKFSFKRVFLVASLSLAGLFGASSVFTKHINVDSVMKEANAAASGTTEVIDGYEYQVVWYYIASKWENTIDGDYGRGLYTSHKFSVDGTNYAIIGSSEHKSDWHMYSEIHGGGVAKLFLPTDATKIDFHSGRNSSKAGVHTGLIDIGKNSGTYSGNSFVLKSSYWGWTDAGDKVQTGLWVSFETLTSTYIKKVYFSVLACEWLARYGYQDIRSLYIWQESSLYNDDGAGTSYGGTHTRNYPLSTTTVLEIDGVDYAEIYIPKMSSGPTTSKLQIAMTYREGENWKKGEEITDFAFVTTYTNPTIYIDSNHSDSTAGWHHTQYQFAQEMGGARIKTRNIYLYPGENGSNWTADGITWFGVWAWDTITRIGKLYDLSEKDGNNYYCSIPTKKNHCKYIRFKSASDKANALESPDTYPSGDLFWNETADLFPSVGHNIFVIQDGSGNGYWYRVDGTYLTGTFNRWGTEYGLIQMEATNQIPNYQVRVKALHLSTNTQTKQIYISNSGTSVTWGNNITSNENCTSDDQTNYPCYSYSSENAYITVEATYDIYVKTDGYDYSKFYLLTPPTLANEYGSYFLANISCDGGANLPTGWDNVNEKYSGLFDDVQYIVWESDTALDTGTDLQNAMYRYDYIIHKYGLEQYEDFIGRITGDILSPGRTFKAINTNNLSLFSLDSENSFPTLIIIIASSVSLLSITALSILLVKKRKSKEQ